MKPQTTGLLLCALLMSTFGHELLARHQVAHSLRHHAHSPLLARSDKPSDPGNITNLTVSINATTEIIIVANLTAHIAIITDVKANLVGLFCGSTGAVIIVDLKTQAGIYVPASSSGGVWNKSEGLDALIQSITSLTVIQQSAQQHCTKFDSTTITAEISLQIHLSLIAVSSGEYCAEGKAALLLLIQITVSLIASLQIGILKVIEGGVCTTKSLQGLIAVFQGLTLLIGELQGGISVIIKSNITINLSIVLSADAAADAFIYILTQLSNGHVNVKGCFKNIDTFRKLVAALGGNCTHGINGVLTVLVEVVALIHSQTTIEAVIDVLLKFGAASSSDSSLSKKWSACIEKLLHFCEQQQLSDIVITDLKAIQSNSAQEGDINISAIITALLAISSGVLHVIVKVLVLLKAKVAIEVSILALVLALVKLLTSVAGAILLVAILGIKIEISMIENIVADIVKALDAIVNVTVANILNLLVAIPILGAIIKAVGDALLSNALILINIIVKIGIQNLLPKIRAILTGGQVCGVATSAVSNTTAGVTEEATTTQAATTTIKTTSEGETRHIMSGINGHGRRGIGGSRHGGSRVNEYEGKHRGHEKHSNKI